jgi:autotransporter-associated beta strand protein
MKTTKTSSLLPSLLALALLAPAAFAADTDTWVGGSGNNFSTSGNWTYSPGPGPVATGDSLVFGGAGSTTPNNDETGFTFNSIGFSSTVAYTLGGNSFTLASGGSITNGAAVTNTINNNITLTGSGGTINPSVASAGLTIGGVISGAANLTKSGNSTSTLTLTGVNTFSGVLNFNAGTVVFTTPPSASGGNLGNPSGITFGGSSTTTVMTSSGAGSVTISSPTITANTSATALFKNGGAAGTTLTISAQITGAGNCKQNTPPTSGAIVRFSGDNNNYTGAFTMAAGIVEYTSVANGGSPAALGGAGTGTYAVADSTSSATLRYVGSGNTTTTRNIDWQGTTGPLTLDNTNTGSVQFLGSGNLRSGSGTAVLTLTGSNTGANALGQVINDGASSGTTSVTKSGSDLWILSGANSYSGGTTNTAGTLQLSGSGTLGSSSGALTISGGTLDLGGTSQSQGAVTISGASLLTNGTLTASSFSTTPASGITATITANLAGSTAAVSHTGTGTLALLGANTYNNGTTVGGGGILTYNSIALAGSACALGDNGTLYLENGAFQYFGPTATNSRTFQFSTLSGTPAWNVDNAGTNTTLTLTANFLGGTNGGAAGARTIGLNVNSPSDGGAAGTLTMLGAIPDVTPTNSTTVVAGGATGYTVFNGGIVGLLNPTNTFSGSVQVKYARTLQVMSLADSNTPCSIGLGTNPPVNGTAGIIIGSTDSQRGGILAYLGTNNASCNRQICVEGVNFGGQSGATFLNNSPNNSSLHFSCAQPVIYYSGVLISNCLFTLGGSANTTNTFDLQITNTPLGNAALTVSGSTWLLTAAHSYAGATTVSGGTLLVNGSLGGTGVTNTGGTLGGSGTISSPVAIQSGGTLQPGPVGGNIGTLTINNTLNLTGKTVMAINRTNSQTASLVTGISTVSYGGTVTVTNVGNPLQAGDTFTLFNAANYTGTFATTNLPALSNGLVWDLSKLAQNGTLTVGGLPAITAAPASQIVECSSNATFTVAGTGYPAPTYQWGVNGSAVSGATSTTFTTNNVHGAGSVYTISVTATNAYGSVTSNATLTVQDTLAPVITINGANPLYVECHGAYTDPGASALDACVGSVAVTTNGTVNTTVTGTNTITYTANDGNGNTGSATRTVIVRDTTPPAIVYYFTNLTLSTTSTNCQALLPDLTGTNYIIALDICSSSVTVTQNPPANTWLPLGTNQVVLTAFDSSNNATNSTNTVVVADQTAPVITLLGASPLTNECHGAFVDPGATAWDNCSGVVSVSTNSTVDPNTVGVYTIAYVAGDAAGNTTTNTRLVYVVDTTPPVVTLNGANPMAVECHSGFIDPGASANDACAGSLSVSVSGAVNANAPGTYTLTYSATDPSGNTGSTNRTVIVQDTTPPQITYWFTNLVLSAASSNCQVSLPDLTGTNYIIAVDTCSSSVTVTQNPPLGTVLSYGTTNEVVLTALDASGNAAYSTNTVVVAEGAAPVITAQPQSLTNLVGTDAAFTVAATSCGPVSYQWYLNTDALADETNATLTVADVQLTDAGSYTVTLANAAGSSTSAVAVLTANQPPVAGNTNAGVTENQALVLGTDKLLAICSDPDGDPLSIISAGPISTNGGTVSLTSSNITYVPATNFVGQDLFNYTVSDGRGGTATGSVLVTVTAASAPALNIVIGPEILPDGHFYIQFVGIPGYRYTIQYSPTLDSPSWTTITNLAAGTNGLFDFEDPTTPLPPSRYYRTTYP